MDEGITAKYRAPAYTLTYWHGVSMSMNSIAKDNMETI